MVRAVTLQSTIWTAYQNTEMDEQDVLHCRRIVKDCAATIGHPVTIRILWEAYHGISYPSDFRSRLDIFPAALTRRLAAMVADGLFECHEDYNDVDQNEYVLTERGLDLCVVILHLVSWGHQNLNKTAAPNATDAHR